MTGIEWKKTETVGVITMNNGQNRQNPDFIRAVLAAFDEIERDSEISSVIISSIPLSSSPSICCCEAY